ncbi:hypothetical protein [Paraliobacillus sp. X-1268]|uniref:hypothetical protein n=1 Tax=Paraliobacillus sp. X-1268 TaxID=2213193 RepID=UPI000E3E9A27|nr:hypothetical protein [Paraliobacillus sp. X-1268]
MSLCLATLTTSGLLVSVDGRGVTQDKNNNVHVVTDTAKKIYKIDNETIIFISGFMESNMLVLDEIIKSGDSSLANISKVCKEKYKQLKQHDFVVKWEHEINNIDQELIEGSIPICLNVFQFKNNTYTVTKFLPQNNFKPETKTLNMGQILFNGIYCNEAVEILKNKKSLVKSLKSEIDRFNFTYGELGKKHKEVGGEIYHYLIKNGTVEEIKNIESIR